MELKKKKKLKIKAPKYRKPFLKYIQERDNMTVSAPKSEKTLDVFEFIEVTNLDSTVKKRYDG